MSNDTMPEEESTDSLKLYLDNYTYLGKDSKGYHHHADKERERIIVCADAGERCGRHDAWVSLTLDDIDHVQAGVRYADELEHWADYVAQARGWEDRALTTFPAMRRSFMEDGL